MNCIHRKANNYMMKKKMEALDTLNNHEKIYSLNLGHILLENETKKSESSHLVYRLGNYNVLSLSQEGNRKRRQRAKDVWGF